MVRSNLLSAAKANRFYWLGRYQNRVYLTLHMINKCCDMMIDGDSSRWSSLASLLEGTDTPRTTQELVDRMIYDEANPSSVLSSQLRAMDNAMMLREDIKTESLCYPELALALIRKSSTKPSFSPVELQPVTDYVFAFWGSVEHRLQNPEAVALVMAGREVEYADMLLRFGYPDPRVRTVLDNLLAKCNTIPAYIDPETNDALHAAQSSATLDRGKLPELLTRLVTV